MTSPANNSYLEALHTDQTNLVISFLPKKETIKLGLTCRKLHAIAKTAIPAKAREENVLLSTRIEFLCPLTPRGIEKICSIATEVGQKVREYLRNTEILIALEGASNSTAEIIQTRMIINRYDQFEALAIQLDRQSKITSRL